MSSSVNSVSLMPKVQKGLFVSRVARKKMKDHFSRRYVIYYVTTRLREAKLKLVTTANFEC